MAGQKDRCLILPNSAQFISEGEDLGGAQRLAVMAVDFSRWSSRSAHGDLRRSQAPLKQRRLKVLGRGYNWPVDSLTNLLTNRGVQDRSMCEATFGRTPRARLA
jgi:hypothetical protein